MCVHTGKWPKIPMRFFLGVYVHVWVCAAPPLRVSCAPKVTHIIVRSFVPTRWFLCRISESEKLQKLGVSTARSFGRFFYGCFTF